MNGPVVHANDMLAEVVWNRIGTDQEECRSQQRASCLVENVESSLNSEERGHEDVCIVIPQLLDISPADQPSIQALVLVGMHTHYTLTETRDVLHKMCYLTSFSITPYHEQDFT